MTSHPYLEPVKDLHDQEGLPGMRLGRSLVSHDPRNRMFPAAGVLFAADAPLRTKTHRRPSAWDQGEYPHCVAFETKGLCCTAPIHRQLPPPLADRKRIDTATWYKRMQDVDEWPGADYDGTSVLAGVKIAKQDGYIGGYRWCFGLDDVLRTLSHHGPVGIGTLWLGSMFQPGPGGLLTVDRSSPNYGGHATELIGIDLRREQVIGMNQWRYTWGDRGRYRMSWDDLGWLLDRQGEAYTTTAAAA